MAAPPSASSSALTHSHRHTRSVRHRHPARPASTLSALFAIVVASSTANALPAATPTSLPPDFLCPSFGSVSGSPPCSHHTATDVAATSPVVTSTGTSIPSTAQSNATSAAIADKYVTGPDGLWRKTNIITLYGSTVCLVAPCVGDPSTTLDVFPSFAVDASSASVAALMPSSALLPSNALSPSTNPANIGSTATAPSTIASSSKPSNLPSGWPDTTSTTDEALTPVIISLSVVLAFAICIFIVMLVALRRKRREKARDREKKVDDVEDGDEDGDSEDSKQARIQQRLWARATARWKANARQAARRRRKRTVLTPKEGESRLLAETQANEHSRSSVTISHSCFEHRPSAYGAINEPVAPADPGSPTTSSRPPAYLPSSALSPTPDGLFHHSPHGKLLSLLPLQENVSSQTARDSALTSAHVATDDKAIFARMIDLASAPPAFDLPRGSQDISGPYATVPPLEDEFEDIPFQLRVFDSGDDETTRSPFSSGCVPSYSRDASPNPSLFPPPPPRARMAAPTFYEYPVSFEEDVIGLEPDVGPSAPPFENDECPAPSAPPLEADYDQQLSAPVLDHFEDEPIPSDCRANLCDSLRTSLEAPPREAAASTSMSAPAPVPSEWRRSPPGYLP
ncbi:hypothetical protein B0H21DRAFT_408912 [Amylocystis lapponica]|nr:hypothetical protein B0H21DRAFT_408912 [Amylocystis lapponica]